MAPRGRAENGLWEPHGKPLDRVGGDLLTGIETGLKHSSEEPSTTTTFG